MNKELYDKLVRLFALEETITTNQEISDEKTNQLESERDVLIDEINVYPEIKEAMLQV